MRLVKTKTSYAVEVPRGKAIALFDLDEPSLNDMLLKVEGVEEVDYDGHFGPFVYVTIDAESDTPVTHEAICNVIESSLAK